MFEVRGRRRRSLAVVAGAAFAATLVACAVRPSPLRAESEGRPAGASQASIPTVSASIDPTEATVGDRLVLTLSVTRDEDVSVEFPDIERAAAPLELLDAHIGRPRTEGRTVTEARRYVLAAFETGRIRVPPMRFPYTAAAGDTAVVFSDSLLVTIGSVVPAAELEGEPEPRDIKPPFELPRRVWPWLALATGIVGALALYYYLRRRWRARRRPEEPLVVEPEARRLAAHLLAFERLRALESEDLVGRGQIDAFYFAVSEILRRYIGDRFAVEAVDMTTGELGVAMRAARIEQEDTSWSVEFLCHADLSKFAKYRPVDERVRDDLRAVWAFVERTRFLGEEDSA